MISGTGAFQQNGPGATVLTGTNTYTGGTTISAGTLQLGNGGTTGSIVGDVSNNGILAVNRSNDYTFGGVISGTGAFQQNGPGTTVLTGANTYTGPTTVNSGILDVNGSLASTVSVNSGGMLKGNGTIGGLNIGSGAIVAPGNSIGTLNVAGNVSFGPGSIYQVEANAAGQADKIAATGNATLAGGSVQVLAQLGNYAPQTKYAILTAAGGVTGTFANVTSNLAFLTPSLSYDANDVFLTLNRSAFFSSQAVTRNQYGVSAALDASPLTSALVLAVLNQTATGARQAFDALSGEVHASVQTTLIENSLFLREAILGRLRQASFAGAPGPTAALGLGGPTLAYAEPANVFAERGGPAFPIKAPPSEGPQTSDVTWWAQGAGAWGRIDGNGNAADVRRNLAGFFTGVDSRFGDNMRAGIATGYINSGVGVAARASSANIDTVHFAAYGDANYGALNFRSGAAFAWSMIGTNRSILFPGFIDSATANYSAGTGQLFGEVGYATALGNVAIEPFAGLAYVHLDTSGFTEVGQVAALAGSHVTEGAGYSSLGLRLATSFALVNGMVLAPHASAYWQHAFSAVTPATGLAFLSTGAGFTTAGVPIARDAAIIDSGLDLWLTPNAKIGVSYFGELAANLRTTP